jgi:hypothetical protein
MTTDVTRHNIRVLVLFMVAAWIVLVASLYFGMHLATNLWIFVFVVWGVAWTGAVVMTLMTVFAIRRWSVLAVGVLAVGVALGLLFAITDWRTVFAVTWFPAHRGQFDEAIELVRTGHLNPETADYGSAQLPARLSSIAVDGEISVVGQCEGRTVLMLPQFVGIPDGAFGYLKFDCDTIPMDGYVNSEDFTPDGDYLDGFGDPLYPRIDLGDGWWWAD